jgi:serine/threonine-protein kinase SRPK3
VGEVLVNRYVLIQKLGWGHFSTVWLAKDFKYGNYAAVKIMKSSPHYLEASYDEVSLMVSKTGRNPTKSGQQRLSSSVDRIPQKI